MYLYNSRFQLDLSMQRHARFAFALRAQSFALTNLDRPDHRDIYNQHNVDAKAFKEARSASHYLDRLAAT
jgi:hypothetical protein